MRKYENNALQIKFYKQLKRTLFLSSVRHNSGTLDMSIGYTRPINEKLGCMHCIVHMIFNKK